MLTFLGYELELHAVQVIVEPAGFSVRYGVDLTGRPWLIIGPDEDAECLAWVCAPVTFRMVEEVAAGRAEAWEAARHSATGVVEVVRVDHGRAVPDRCVRSADLPPGHPTNLYDDRILAA